MTPEELINELNLLSVEEREELFKSLRGSYCYNGKMYYSKERNNDQET